MWITPKPHQIEAHRFLLSNRRAFNLSEMGTGKTLPCVLAVKDLWDNKAVSRVLVVAPLSTIGPVWDEHFFQFAPHIPRVLANKSYKRLNKLQSLTRGGVCIINPDGVKSLQHDIARWNPDLVIIDELSGYYRNAQTSRWASMAKLLGASNRPAWGLTGTPIPKALTDAYAQLLLMNPSALPRKRNGSVIMFTAFRDMFHNQPYPNIWTPKPGALEQVWGMMQPSVRFTRAQVMSELGATVRMRREVALSSEQAKMLADLKAQGVAKYGTAEIKAVNAQAELIKAVQIACGAVYASGDKNIRVPTKARLDAVLEIYEEAQSPIILAVPFINVAHLLLEMVTEKGLRGAMIIGDTPADRRTEIVRDFQGGGIDVLILHPKTAAHGLTLTRSHVVVWYAPLYDLELYNQLNDRVSRFGQSEQPLVIEIFSTQVELKIYNALRSKEKLQGTFLSLFEV